MADYVPVFISLFAVLGVGTVLTLLATFFGPKKEFPDKQEPFDCGNPNVGDPHTRHSIKFYVVGILFLLFDVEVIYLYTFASLARDLGMFGFIEISLFVAVLVIGLAYVWRKGALEWG